jgi:hypothetical protein
MRAFVVLIYLVTLTTACGSHASQVSSAGATPSSASTVAPVTAAPTPRVTSGATKDCTVSWAHHYRTLADLAAAADVVVRAVPIAQDIVQLRPGFGPKATRDARRTTFAVTSVVRTKGAQPPEVRVLEDVCPNLESRPGDEWLLFLYRWDPAGYGPDDPHEHWLALGGPQGQFRFAQGVVSGPFYVFAEVVHSYEGATVAEVVADLP